MKKQITTGLLMLITMTFITGIVYPLFVTGAAQTLLHNKANGSLIYQDGRLKGSTLIGQQFTGPGYFHGRPSAAGGNGYDATSSAGSNLGPTNSVLIDRAAKMAKEIRKENGLSENASVPVDLITASASGLDPDISPESAYMQVPRIAKERKMPESAVKELVKKYTEGPQFGILGESRVNVLKINLALDAQESK